MCLHSLKNKGSTANKTLVFGMFKIYSKVYNCFANYDVRHSKNEFDNNHINGIKNFYGYSKYRLSKFNE